MAPPEIEEKLVLLKGSRYIRKIGGWNIFILRGSVWVDLESGSMRCAEHDMSLEITAFFENLKKCPSCAAAGLITFIDLF